MPHAGFLLAATNPQVYANRYVCRLKEVAVKTPLAFLLFLISVFLLAGCNTVHVNFAGKTDGDQTVTDGDTAANGSCDDGNPCTYGDFYDDAGSCVGYAVVCEADSDPCGIIHTCNGTSTCSAGYAAAGTSCTPSEEYGLGKCNGKGACLWAGCKSDYFISEEQTDLCTPPSKKSLWVTITPVL